MMARFPGQFLSLDATYKLATRCLDADLGAWTFALGEKHDCCAFWATDTDKLESIMAGLTKMKERASAGRRCGWLEL